MSVIHTPKKPDLDLRILLFPAVTLVSLSGLFLRLWYFQVVEAPSLVERAEATRVVPVTKPAPRGLVFDRNGIPIATVKPEIVVTAIPNVVKANPWVLDRVAKMLSVPVDKLERKLRDAMWHPYLPSPIYVGADIRSGTQIAEAGADLPGIAVETEPLRTYPDTKSFAHVLGYVWTPNDHDVKRIAALKRPLPDYVGKTGIERAFDAELMGTPGADRMAMDARRRPIRVEGRDAPTPGEQLVLTLDASLQKYTTALLEQNQFSGAAVALDPKSGEVLALVSNPTFDQSVFQGGVSDEEWRLLNDSSSKPMFNRAISGSYAPGSTFKIVTSVAAAMTGKFSRNTTYFCPGGFFRNGVHLKCLGTHGAIGYEKALSDSCNTYFCNLGVSVGEDALRAAALGMGLGQRTGIEIGGPSESRGVIPTMDWLRKVSHKKNPPWYLGDTANFSIGQGYVATTPLQMANVAAMVANNGTSYKPHLVKEFRGPLGKDIRKVEPEVLHHIELPDDFWAELRHALEGVVDHGTGTGAKISNMLVAGKTGSAEHGKGLLTHAWFVAFAPADDPKIVVCVVAEGAGHGTKVVPVARQMIEHYLLAAKKLAPAVSSSVTALSSPAALSNAANR